ncbi:MAG: hypothetical protein V7711_02335, partial [Pseudomonadales bacterium]
AVGADVTVDGGEITDHRWLSPDRALQVHRAGEVSLMPPTYITLLELASASSVAGALEAYTQRGMRHYLPHVTKDGDAMCFLYQGDAGYEQVDPSVPGARHRTLMTSAGYDFQSTLDD